MNKLNTYNVLKFRRSSKSVSNNIVMLFPWRSLKKKEKIIMNIRVSKNYFNGKQIGLTENKILGKIHEPTIDKPR